MNTTIKQRIERINSGQIPEGYKRTKIGIMPIEWEDKLFSEFIVEKSEFSSDTATNPLYSMTVENGVTAKTERYERSFLVKSEEDSYKVVEEDDFVYNPMNITIGAVAISKIPYKVLVSRYYDIFSVDESKCDKTFFINYLKSDFMNKYFNMVATGSIKEKQRVHLSQLNNFRLPFPNIIEQQKIAEILSTWDRTIEIQEKLIVKLEKRHKWLRKELLSGQIRLSGFTEPFVKKSVNEVASFFDNLRVPISEALREEGNTPYYGANGIQGYIKGYTHEGEFVLIAEDGASDWLDYPVNYVSGKIWVNNHAHVIQGKEGQIDTKFLQYAIKEISFPTYLVGGTRAKLNLGILQTIEINMPVDINEQQRVVEILRGTDFEVEKMRRKLQKLKLQKQALMQLLLTGVVKVKL